MSDDPLTPQEQDALAGLVRDVAPPPGLEDRVVIALRDSGHLRARRRAGSVWLRVAAAIVLVAAGVVAGRLTAAPALAEGGDYLLLLYGSAAASGKSENALAAEYSAWADSLRARRSLVAAERLAAEATVVGAASTATDQPVGFFLITSGTAAAATAIASSCPHVKYGGIVVVKRVE